MGLFNAFIALDSTSIPTFDPSIDSINLQVKSLLYLFKRLRINKLLPLLKNGELTYTDSLVGDRSDPTFAKLDKTYNVIRFKEMLLDDEYRVLVDFIKNKFRSMCFIDDLPTNLSRPRSPTRNLSMDAVSAVDVDDDFLPPFLDYKERNTKLFKFTLFSISQPHTTESIASILSGSNIYIEHKVPFLKRYNIALTATNKVIGKPLTTKFTIDQKQKLKIIRNYLTLLATHVQVMRIYHEYTKMHPVVVATTTTNLLSHSASKLSLHDSSQTSSPTKTTSRSKSSPTKLARRDVHAQPALRKKPSVLKLRLEELYNPVTNPPQFQSTNANRGNDTSSVSASDSITLSEDVESREILRLDVYERCKLAVGEKIKSERKKLNNDMAN